jgi:peptidyl-prolyl cis-trans isomerase SurA
LGELNARVNDFAVQLRVNTANSQDMAALKKQVLERMIQNQIQLQQAARLGITIDDVSLNRVLVALAESNKLTLDQLRARLEADGMDFARFREQSREDLIIKQLEQRLVTDKVSVTDQEVKQYISSSSESSKNQRYHINHMLIATPQTAKPEDITKAHKKAELIYQSLQKGQAFADAAIRNSDGRNALQGGNLGWRTASELPESFVTTLLTMKDGEISQPIRSASGFHIIKLVESSNSAEMIEQNHSRHILIRANSELDDDGARELLNKLKTQILNGDDFAELAKQYSQDPGSKDKGGDLGWADPGQFVDSFEDAIAGLKPGEISEPFRSQFGWHLVQLLERRKQQQTSATVEAQARNQIRKRKIDEELRLWLRRIRDEAYVEFVDPSLAPLDAHQDE